MSKNLPHIFLLFVISASLIILSGCNKQGGCTDPSAENFDPSAEVEDGTCALQREKFLGIYSGFNQCIGSPAASFISEIIPANGNLDDVIITNLGGRFTNTTRAIVDRNNLTIPLQDPDANGTYVSGTGSIIGNLLSITYQVTYLGEQDQCIYSLEK